MAIGDYQREGEWIEAKFYSRGKEGRGGPHIWDPKKCLRRAFGGISHRLQ
jgi:hypothetical protein